MTVITVRLRNAFDRKATVAKKPFTKSESWRKVTPAHDIWWKSGLPDFFLVQNTKTGKNIPKMP
jgi:hypothetical protein